MPPKRAKKPTSSLTQHQLTELTEAWSLFSPSASTNTPIPRHATRSVLAALGLTTNRHELAEILDTVDPDNSGEVEYARFLEVVELKMRYRDVKAEVEDAYELFQPDEGGIGLEELRRVARELKEEVSEEELREMLEVATGGDGKGRVGLTEFEEVMRRAGVI